MSAVPHRPDSMRYSGYDYSTPGAYFNTFCTAQRREIFGVVDRDRVILSPAGQVMAEDIALLPSRHPHLSVDSSIVMPNHVHLLLFIYAEHSPELTHFRQAADSPNASEVVRGLKSFAGRRINLLLGSTGSAVFQRGFYDHVVRTDDERNIQRIREYIANNPKAWHLDRENSQRTGESDFYTWIDSFGKLKR